MNSPMFSRSGRSNVDGKLTQRLDVPVSQEMEEDVITLARIAGVSKAEWVRDLIERTVHGEMAVLRSRVWRASRAEQDDDNRTNVG